VFGAATTASSDGDRCGALFFAFGGGALAYASGLIPGSRIKNHSIPAKKLTKSAVKSQRGLRGPAGPKGDGGPRSAKGDTGRKGAQGPGGTIVTYDAPASASPTVTTVGTFLGDTLKASYSIPVAGQAQLNVFITTSNGAWNVAVSELDKVNGAALPPRASRGWTSPPAASRREPRSETWRQTRAATSPTIKSTSSSSLRQPGR
jgi:hypothetical protein